MNVFKVRVVYLSRCVGRKLISSVIYAFDIRLYFTENKRSPSQITRVVLCILFIFTFVFNF